MRLPALKYRIPTARADMLFKLGRMAEARAEFERAAAMTENEREKRVLLQHARGADA